VSEIETIQASSTTLPTTERVRRLAAAATESVAASDRDNTLRAYASDLRDLEKFLAAEDVQLSVGRAWSQQSRTAITLPELALYLAHLDSERSAALATIRRRCAAVARWHRDAGLPSPTDEAVIRRQLRGIVARHCDSQKKRKRPFTAAHFLAAVAAREWPLMHRVLIVVGLVTGCRRSELTQMRWADIQPESGGYVVSIYRAKTDRSGVGQRVGLPRGASPDRCPVALLEKWREQADTNEPRIFPISDQTVRLIVLRAVAAIGLDPAEFGAHSLRAGFVTNANRRGVTIGEIMQGSRHRSYDVAASYIRDAEALENAAFKAMVDALNEFT
jgi:integrase